MKPLTQRDIQKLACHYMSGGGTFDSGDLLDMMEEDGISDDLWEAERVANAISDMCFELDRKALGWEKLKGRVPSSLDAR